jgi:hypothetical protein
MTRSLIICLLALVLAACASLPEAPIVTASASPVSEELECMSDCLGGSDSSGDSCVERCL